MKKEKVLFSEEQIAQRVQEVGKELSRDYKDKKPLIIALLRGSFVYAADLVRAMDIDVEVDFMTTASYGHGEKTTGVVNILSDVRAQVKDRDVIIVDDIIDSGYTMKAITDFVLSKGPKSVKRCVVLDKPSRREADINAEYVCFTIPDLFIVGYGLNYGDFKRNIPYIYTYVDEEEENQA